MDLGRLWDIWLSAFVLAIVLRSVMIWRLRTKHHAVWEVLDKPTLWNGNFNRQRLEMLFLFRAEYWRTRDNLLRISSILYTALYFIVVPLFIYLVGMSFTHPTGQ